MDSRFRIIRPNRLTSHLGYEDVTCYSCGQTFILDELAYDHVRFDGNDQVNHAQCPSCDKLIEIVFVDYLKYGGE